MLLLPLTPILATDMPATISLPAKLAAAWPPERWRGVTVLAAVSGGSDSVALARALHVLQGGGDGRLILAHFNHRLRGPASDGDQAFVEQLGRDLRLPVVVGMAQDPVQFSEAVLRDERYAFLEKTAGLHGARYLATAHTADDQVETQLANILRGTGLAGLAGIPRTRPLNEATTIVRPLLDVSRAEVLEYLAALGQDYREDASNVELRYTRNRIRHELLPLLEREFNPHVREALLRLSRIAGEADALLDTLADQLLAAHQRPIPGGFAVPLQALQDVPELLARHALQRAWNQQGWPLQEMGFEKWQQLLKFAATRPIDSLGAAGQTLPGGVAARIDNQELRLTRAAL